MNWLIDCCSAEHSTAAAAAAAAAAAQPSRHCSSVQSKQLCLYYVQGVTIVIMNCFYRMLQTDMQLSSIYLASELVAAVWKFHRYRLGCYAQLWHGVFCAFLQHCFLPTNGDRLSALRCVISN